MTTIVCFGECMVELRQERSMANEVTLKQGFAGDVFNTCVYLKRLFSNIDVEFATQVGRDPLSLAMIDMFRREHLGHNFVTHDDTRSPGLYWITTDAVGERSFTYWRDNSAARYHVAAIDGSVTTLLSRCDWLFISGISLAVIQPHLRSTFWNLISRLKEQGCQMIFDPNYRPTLWSSKEETKEQYALAYEYSDMVLPGVEDMAALYQLSDVRQVADFLSPYNIEELVIKNGAQSVLTIFQGEEQIVPVTPVEQVVDTTSAGDSFNGAYIGARLSGWSPQEAADLASRTAGFVIQHPGAIVEHRVFNDFKHSLEALS